MSMTANAAELLFPQNSKTCLNYVSCATQK
jgi:hypothetical protein